MSGCDFDGNHHQGLLYRTHAKVDCDHAAKSSITCEGHTKMLFASVLKCVVCLAPITLAEPVRLPYAQQDCVGDSDTDEQCAGALNTMNSGCPCGLQRQTMVICDVHAETACRFAYALYCPDCEATVELSEPVRL